MKMKINEMEIDITRQENFPEEHFGRFIEIMEEYLKCKENIRTAKEIKEVIEMILLKKFPLDRTLEEMREHFKTDEIERTHIILGEEIPIGKETTEEKLRRGAEHIASIVEDCLIDNGGFLMWWNRAGEFKDSETAKFTNKMVTLSEEDRAEYNFGC